MAKLPIQKTKLACGVALGILSMQPFSESLAQSSEAGASLLEEVVVTARRSEENLQDIPVAVSALSADGLTQRNIIDVRQLQSAVPTLRISPNNQGSDLTPQFQVRGLGGPDNVSQSIAEVPLWTTRATTANMYDLANVQILRGPQGTLFGKNSTGGAVIMTPAAPEEEFGGNVTGSLGNYDSRQIDFVVNAPLTDVFSSRIAGQYQKRDGLQENISPGSPDLDSRDNGGLRGSLLFTPNQSLDNLTILDYRTFDQELKAPVLTAGQPCVDFTSTRLGCGYKFVVGVDLTELAAEQAARGPQKVDIDTSKNYADQHLDSDVWGITNITNLSLGESMSAKSILAYREDDSTYEQDTDGTSLQMLNIGYRDKNDQTSAEFQLLGNSFDSTLDWVVGAYGADFTIIRDTGAYIFADLDVLEQAANNQTDGTSFGVYGQGTLDLPFLLDGLSVTAGLRNTWDDREQDTQQLRGVPSSPPPTTCNLVAPEDPINCTSNFHAEYDDYNYTFSVDYQVNDGTLVYVAARRGYTAGGFNNNTILPDKTEYLPETFEDIEIGFKTEFSLGSIPTRFNFAYFDGDYDDVQVVQIYVVDTGTPQRVIENAATATLNGFEADFTMELLEGLLLSGFYSFTEGEYDEYIVTVPGSGQLVDLSGTAFESVPEDTAGANLYYSTALPGNAGSLGFNVDYYYRSSLSTNQLLEDPKQGKVPSYSLWGGRIEWLGIFGSQFDVSIWGRNLADEEYVEATTVQLGDLGWNNAFYGEPLTYGVSLNYRFGD